MKTPQDDAKIDSKASLDFEKNSVKIAEILSIYENGIESIFESSKKEEENYLFLLFNCTDSFHQKYSNINKSNSNILNHSTTLKFYKEMGKKQKNQDAKNNINNLEYSRLSTFENKEIFEINIQQEDNKYILMLQNVFEKFFGPNENLLEELVKKYLTLKKTEINNEFDYEDFIYLFCSIIKYFSGLNISLELNENENYLLIFIYGDEKSYTNICKLFNYQLQLKPIAIEYEKNHLKNKKKDNLDLKESFKDIDIIDYNEQEPLLDSFNKIQNINNLQFEDYDINNPIFWPPYYSYRPEKDDKFRVYDSNDDYFNDSNDGNNYVEFDKKYSSKFRNIDKLRFIQRILNQIIKFSELKKIDIFEMMIFKRNNKSYQEKIKELDYKKIYNPFDEKLCSKTINTMRNYYGESISYFFLWLDYYIHMLIFPSIIGVLTFVSYYIWRDKKIPFISFFSDSIKMDYYDFLLILNCVLLTLWLTLFIKTWAQKEKIYNYIWGVSESQKEDKINEEFVPNSRQKLIFGYYVPTDKEPFHTFKNYMSYVVLLAMIIIVISIIYSLFSLKARLIIPGNRWHNYKISVFIACLNGLQIKIMNYIYYYIALFLNDWENHFSITEKNNSLAKKLILFDFVNSYSSLFYIAFIKPYHEGCIENNCLKEIETQMYSIFFVYLSVFFAELFYLYMIYYYQKGKVGSLLTEEKIETQGLEHQMMTSPLDSLNIEYNDIINQFGFACLFSIAAPLTPLIIFLLAMVYRLTNYHKFIHLTRVEILDESKGISFYNKIIKSFLFIGVLVNVAIFLFSNHNQIVPSDPTNPNLVHQLNPMNPQDTINAIKNKFLTVFLVENSLLLIYFYVDWNILPKWFKYKDIIKDLYLNKYFFKNEGKKIK